MRPVRRLAACAAGLALFLAVAAPLPAALELTVRPAAGGEPLIRTALRPGQGFTLYYHHSVNHLPIWEVHSVDGGGRIFVEEERFLSFNAGMGHLRGRGRHIMEEDGRQAIVDMHTPVGRMVLRVGSQAVSHTLIWPGGRVNLSPLAEGRAVEISARPVGLGGWAWLASCGARP